MGPTTEITIHYNLFTKLVQACKPLYKIHSNICHFWVFWGEFRDSWIQTSGFESRTHESTSKIFESLESNGKLTRSREQHHWDSLALAFSSVSMIFSRIFSINLSTILRGEVLWFSTDTLALIYIKFTKNRHYGVDVMALKSFPYFNKSFWKCPVAEKGPEVSGDSSWVHTHKTFKRALKHRRVLIVNQSVSAQ